MQETRQNVLIVHNYYQIPGGEDTVVANEKKLLEKQGHKVILYTRNNSELKKISKIQKLFLPVNIVFNFNVYNDIKKIIKEEHIDIVHVHNTLTMISPSVYYAALSCAIPVIQTIHNFRLLCPAATFYRDGHICEDCVEKGLQCAVKHNCYRESKLQTLACVISTKIHRMTGVYGKINYICLTEFNKEKLLQLKQIKPEKVFIKSNFVDQQRAIIPAKKRKNQCVFAGRLDKLKGIDVLFEVWKKMGERAPQLIVCGTGPMEEWCRSYIEDYKIKNIKMLGFISNEQTKNIIAESRALILPTQWYEGFPMSIVEAFSVGTPVIGSDIGNVGSIIEDGITGAKFSPNNKDDISAAIIRTLENEKNIDSTYFSYKCSYTSEINYLKMKKIYDTICS